MSKYIDRDKLAEFARHSTIGIDANDIMRFPTADVVEKSKLKELLIDYLGGLYPAHEFMDMLEEELEEEAK